MKNTANEVIPQLFGESMIRTTIIEGEPWFVAKDICDALGLSNTTMTLKALEDEEKITLSNTYGNPRAGIPHEMNYVSESGLYALIFKSRKEEAVAFRLWVTKEVLPSLRRRGYYGRREKAMTVFVRELMEMGLESRDATKLALSAYPPLTRSEQRKMELEEMNQAAAPDEDIAGILSATRAGVQYRTKDLHSLLPEGHRILKIKTVKGRETALGSLMERLVRLGYFLRINARHATFERVAQTSEKIVAMER